MQVSGVLEQSHVIHKRELYAFWKIAHSVLLSPGRYRALDHEVPSDVVSKTTCCVLGGVRLTKSLSWLGPVAVYCRVEVAHLGSTQSRTRGHKRTAWAGSPDPPCYPIIVPQCSSLRSLPFRKSCVTKEKENKKAWALLVEGSAQCMDATWKLIVAALQLHSLWDCGLERQWR